MTILSTPPEQRIIRMGHPLAFAAFLRHIGAPVDRHFQRQGLPALCEDPDAFVPLRRAWAFFEATARSEDPMLGWHVGKFVGDHNLNRAFLSKLKHAPTLYQALKQFVRMSSAEASHIQLGIWEHSDDIVIFTHYPDMKGTPGYTSSQSYQLGVILGVIRHFCGKNWVPKEVGIEYSVVPAVARKLLPGCRILPRQRVGYITIPRSCLHLAPQNSNSDVAGKDPLVLTKEFDYIDTLRALLRPYLLEGYPDAPLAASLLDTSVRTLNRRLSDSNLTYRAVIDGLRFDQAKKLLKDTDTAIIDVADAVGFEDPANFSRMFRRVGGLSPREFRKTARS